MRNSMKNLGFINKLVQLLDFLLGAIKNLDVLLIEKEQEMGGFLRELVSLVIKPRDYHKDLFLEFLVFV